MQYMNQMGLGSGMGFDLPLWGAPVFIIILIWGIFWKGLALWHTSKRDERWWFLAFLVINTAGILEIIYLFAFAKMKWQEIISVFKK